MTDEELINLTAGKIRAAKSSDYCISDVRYCLSTVDISFRPCLPVTSQFPHIGGALLLGLNPSVFGWYLQDFLASQDSEQDMMTAIQMLAVDYGGGGGGGGGGAGGQ